ncbi:MAG: C10 family peptidase, partial [Bacteroidales bacterium]|nr:C10 family peptidase [Bacteroidales bacterium]
MKRLFLLALLVLFTLPIFAKHVDVETAQTVARSFWEQNIDKSTPATFSDVTSQTEFTNFYIFNTDGGFVIVSSYDIAYPVLGYSNEGSFNTSNIGINTLEWLRGYQRQIQFGIDNDIKATEEISNQWYNLQNGIPSMHKSTRAVSALLTTKWNQGSPYNLLCPYDDRTDENAVTGCVATAMAQVMKYWNYPTRGTGSYSYSYDNSYYGTQSADFENTTYDWNNMPDRVLSYSTQAEKDAVSTLMYHCGVAVGMNYGTVANGGGSAAHTIAQGLPNEHCTELAFKDYFGYKTTLQGLFRENYTGDWDNMLKAELNARRPIIYSGNGTGSGAGHCFVCDGYNDNDYFHFNWGWGGGYDGFFLSTALTPGGGGIGSDDDNNYSYRQSVIIGIEPAGVTVSPEIIEAASAGGNYSATVKAGTAASSWSSTSSASWLTISPTTGAGSEATTQITVTATANTGSSPRTATVTFTHGSTSPTILTVVQPDAYTESCVTMHEDRFSSPAMYYISEDVGYLFGVNTYNRQAYAEVFEATGNTNYDLNSIVFMYGVEGEEGSVTFKVWADNDGVPGGELASKTVTLSDLYASGNVVGSKKVGYYTWTLNPSIVVPNKFFAGIDVSNATSRFALYSTTNNDQEYTNGRYCLSGTNWSPYNTALSMYVLPTICPTDAPFYLLAALPSSLSYIADGGSKNITVNSNTNWTATTSADWLTLSPTSGSNNGSITAVAAANTTNGERTATITVSASGVNPQTISVTQADPSECFIAHEDRFTGTPIIYSANGGGYVCGNSSSGYQAKAELFELSSRYYNITSIDFMYAADGNEGSVTFKVWGNNNGKPGDVLASKTVTLSELYSAGTTVSGSEKKGTYTWTLTTPVAISGNFFAGIDVSNATSHIGLYSTASGYENSCYQLYSNGYWYAISSSWGVDISMYVLPTLCPIANYVFVSPSTLNYSADGGSNDVTVNSNINWTATTSANWLTISPASGSGNGAFSVVAAENTSNGERTATITVSGSGASSQTISVTQDDPNACIVLNEERFSGTLIPYGVSASDGGGFVCGKNNYTQACAELFEIADRYYNLTSIDFMYAVEGEEGSVTFKVWDINNGKPSDVLASKTVTLSELYSAGTTVSSTRKKGIYTWTLTTPVTISSNFFAGIDVSNSTSFIGLYSTASGSGYSNYCYYQAPSSGNWYAISSTWGLDVSTYVLPTICPIPSYNITVSANNDAYGTVTGGGTFSEGTQVTVSANPTTGYNFINWTENSSVVSTNANYTFTANANRTLVANFEAITYTVTANANPVAGGSITGAGSYTYGQTVTLNATANTGYTFINWTENGTEVSTNTQYSFAATADRTLVANFQINTYTISASASPAAGGTVNGAGNYTHGQNVALRAVANTGYNFVNWTENGMIVSTNANYSFSANTNRTLVANFAAITYTITA